MVGALALVGLGVGVAAIVVVVLALYLLGQRRSHREGTSGFVQRSRLACPKCEKEFDYEWVPGAALTAVRLGKDRYMACPLCHKWSLFNVWDAKAPPAKHAA